MPAAIEQTLDLSAVQVFDSQQVPGIGASGVQILSQSPADFMIPGRVLRLPAGSQLDPGSTRAVAIESTNLRVDDEAMPKLFAKIEKA